MAPTTSDPRRRQQLAEARAIRDFARRELGLPDNDSYRACADLGRPHMVWHVFAAPECCLHAKRWCLLEVACVSYRGYCDRRDAEQLAAKLRHQEVTRPSSAACLRHSRVFR